MMMISRMSPDLRTVMRPCCGSAQLAARYIHSLPQSCQEDHCSNIIIMEVLVIIGQYLEVRQSRLRYC